MRVLILAGGYAKRMWPLTKEYPKVLLPVAGRPVIEYIIEKLERIPEIEYIHISTNQKFEKNFKEWLNGFSSTKNIKLLVEPTQREEEKLGSIGALKFFIENENIDDDLLIIGGDNLFEFELSKLVEFFKEKKTPVMAFYDMGDIEKVKKKYGVCILDEKGRVVEFQEKPENPKSSLASTAVYLLPREHLKMVKEYLDGENNPDAFGFFIDWLKDRVTIHGFTFQEKWFDIGSFESYEEAKQHFENQ